MTREEMKELKGLAASMGLYDDKKPCNRAVILGKAIEELERAEIEQNAYPIVHGVNNHELGMTLYGYCRSSTSTRRKGSVRMAGMIKRQVIAFWYTPEEKMPNEGERVPVVISGHDGNTRFDHALQIGSWMNDGLGWLVEGLSDDAQFVVDTWCDLELPE